MLGVGWEGNPWRSTRGQVRGGHILESSFLLWLQKLSLNCFHFSVGKVLKEFLANSLGPTLPRSPLSFSGPTLGTDFILYSTVTRSDFFFSSRLSLFILLSFLLVSLILVLHWTLLFMAHLCLSLPHGNHGWAHSDHYPSSHSFTEKFLVGSSLEKFPALQDLYPDSSPCLSSCRLLDLS